MDFLVIPAYKPDLTLIHLLQRVKAKSSLHVVVVNDGSPASYNSIFQEAQKCATILYYPSNQGKGQALKNAFTYIDTLGQYETVVTADADGQHNVWDIFRVSKKAQENPNHLILGVRSFSGKVPLRSAFGNKVTRFLFQRQTGISVTDTQTGLRGFTTNMIPFMLDIEGQRYEYEMNMLLSASTKYPISEVPIETIYINDNQASHFRPIRDGFMIYKKMFKFALSSISSFLIDYIVYALALLVLATVPTSLKILLANGVARVTSSIVNYSTNKKLVFKNKDSVAKTGTGYFGLALGLFILDTLLIRLFYAIFGLNLLIVKIIVGSLLFCLSWLVQKKLFSKKGLTPYHEILKKSYTYASLFGMLLTGSFTYSMLKTFVLSEAITTVKSSSTSTSTTNAKTATNATKTNKSYKDDNVSINLTTKNVSNTKVYIADITVSSPKYLKTALAQNTYGNNVTAKTSVTAANNNAILAINGDFYGANTTGYVIRNGVVYRNTVREDASNGDLAIYKDGSFGIVYENDVSAEDLVKNGVVNLLAFGPTLVNNGKITVSSNSEVGQSMASNPRTAIGIIDKTHYVIVVSDGRTSESQGLSLYQLAQVMKSYGVKTAYNLDGGGSSTLYFNRKVVNKPTTNGTISERAVSDIVYIGY